MTRAAMTLHRLAVLVLLVILLPTMGASGDAPTTLRESSYPEPVKNITHSPWGPVRGQDVTVTLTLQPGAAHPDAVSIIWCRVEPDYVCAAIPPRMTLRSDGEWTGVIPGAYGGERDVIKRDTVHVGYNVTLRYGDERIHAPIKHYWLPETFPAGADGHYYFIAYSDPPRAIPAAPLAVLLAVFALARALDPARRRGGEPR